MSLARNARQHVNGTIADQCLDRDWDGPLVGHNLSHEAPCCSNEAPLPKQPRPLSYGPGPWKCLALQFTKLDIATLGVGTATESTT